jgi:hypothetical protein
MVKRQPDTRRHTRVQPSSALTGSIGPDQVQITDIGLGGARLVHRAMLRPGRVCSLRVRAGEEVLTFPVRVIWWEPTAVDEGTDSGLHYCSGIAFEDPPESLKAKLAALLAARNKGGPG